MNVSDFGTLYAYHRWANARIVDACRAIGAEKFAAPAGGSFGSIKDTLAHVAWAEWLWLERWQHRSPRVAALPDASTLDSIARVIAGVARGQLSFIEKLTDDGLQERIAYRNIQGETREYTLGRMLQHVVNHSTYHRGQVVTLLRQVHASPPSTDFLLWFDEGMPAGKAGDKSQGSEKPSERDNTGAKQPRRQEAFAAGNRSNRYTNKVTRKG